jgi:hypothetical protein
VVARAGVPPLNAVVALSPSDVWAVGGSSGGFSTPAISRPVIVHWDGRRLQTQTFPWKYAAFNGVAAASRDDVWAVGSAGAKPLVARWDGRSWRRVPLPAVAGRNVWLSGVAVPAPDDVWVVGGWGGLSSWPLLMHWDGARWQRVDLLRIAPALGDLIATDARAPDDVWAAGMEGNSRNESYGYTDYVLHWDGQTWRRVASPLTDEETNGAFARSISIGLSGEVWTANSDESGNAPYFVRWSGPTRTTTHVYEWDIDPILQTVNGIAAVTTSDVWAVGEVDFGRPSRLDNSPFVAHWNGKGWQLQRTPFDTLQNEGGADTNQGLKAIFALSPQDIWAVGDDLIVRYSC